MKKLSTIILIVTGAFFVFHVLFLWMYTNIDGYFYWAFGQYVKTGVYPFLPSFTYLRPTTISPPLYGIFLMLLGFLPRADIIIHILQLCMLAGTATLLYKLLTPFVTKPVALILSCLFVFFPANVLYSSSMMTEIPAQFLFTLWVFLVYRFVQSRNISYLSHAVFLAAVMTILKYQFLFSGAVSFGLFVYFFFQKHITRAVHIFPVALSVGILLLWVITNHAITGVWGLSDTRKMPFYTNFVWDGRHFPKETDPAVIALRAFVPPAAINTRQYWDIQYLILPRVNGDWRAVDELLGNVGLAAIREQPFSYLANAGRVFVQIHTKTAPWWNNMATFGLRDPDQPLYCDALSSIQFCRPIILTPQSFEWWNAYVNIATSFYNAVFPLYAVIIFFPALIITLFKGQRRERIFPLLYLANMLPISFLAFVESRYLVPFYPLILIISTLGLRMVGRVIVRKISFSRLRFTKQKE